MKLSYGVRKLNNVVNGAPTTLRSVGAHYHWRYVYLYRLYA